MQVCELYVSSYSLTRRDISFFPKFREKNFPFRSGGLYSVPRSYAGLTFCLWQSFPRQGNWCWMNGQTKCDSEESSEDNMNGLSLTSPRSRLVAQSFVAKTGSLGSRKRCPSGRSGMVSVCGSRLCGV